MYKPIYDKHKTVDELSEEFRNFIRYFNNMFSIGTSVPTNDKGQSGSMRVVFDGTTMKVYIKGTHGQSEVWKFKTFNNT